MTVAARTVRIRPGPGEAPPQQPVDDAAPNELQALILSLINDARTQGRNCGTEPFPPTNEVVWDVRIEDAAIEHSEDMAAMGMLTHVGSDGSDAGDRLMMQGYNAFSWGENLVVGVDDAEAAIESLFDSPSHCGIIMNSSVNEIGMASAVGLFQGFTTTYWTLVLASERP